MAKKQQQAPENPEKQVFRYADFEDIGKNRRCTDIFFLLFIIAGWAIMTIMGLSAIGIITTPTINRGNPDRLFHGMFYTF